MKLNKKWGIIGLTLGLIIAFGFYLTSLALWGSNFFVFRVTPALNVVEKIRSAEKQGGPVELTEADTNGLGELITKKVSGNKGKYLKGIYFTISEDHLLTVWLPVEYKNINLMINVTGEVSLDQNMITFSPSSVYLGKLPISRDYVMEKLSSLNVNDVVIKAGSVQISKELLPFSLTGLSVANGKIVVTIPKVEIQNQTQNSQAPQKAPSTTTGTSTTTKQDILKRASVQLRTVYNNVKTSGEKDVIGQILVTVNKMIQNPDYPYQAEANAVKAKYSALTTDEKNDIKNAILDYMDTGTLKEIRSKFGL